MNAGEVALLAVIVAYAGGATFLYCTSIAKIKNGGMRRVFRDTARVSVAMMVVACLLFVLFL